MAADASGGTPVAAHQSATDRMAQAGVVPVAWQRVWPRKETSDATIALVQQHRDAYCMGIANAWTMEHTTPKRGNLNGAPPAPKPACSTVVQEDVPDTR